MILFPDTDPDRRWRRVHTVVWSAAITAPALTLTAILTGHPNLAVTAVLADMVVSAAGYLTTRAYHHRIRAELTHARRDPLTGLPTRAVADALLDAATANGTDVTIALADIDGLHAVNNAFGHAAGDQYLRTVATRLARAVPDGGYLIRDGGDEFTVVSSETAPAALAAAIRAAMAGPTFIAGHRLHPRASVGVATSGGGDARQARACADAAMYTAKAFGGNHILTYHPDRDGHPNIDGTRPPIRRRDLVPAMSTAGWPPTTGDEVISLVWTVEEADTIRHALRAAADRTGRCAAIADRIGPVIDAARGATDRQVRP